MGSDLAEPIASCNGTQKHSWTGLTGFSTITFLSILLILSNKNWNGRSWLRRRPRFSLRTLVIAMTIACFYFGCWPVTATTGVRDVEKQLNRGKWPVVSAIPKAPFLLSFHRITVLSPPNQAPQTVEEYGYYVWFFGWLAKVPFANEETRVLYIVPD